MQQYGILVVDDSAFMRRAISMILEKDPQLFVVGVARNGIEAVEKAVRFKPDVITLDVEMPEMDGLAALKQIMRDCPIPTVMLSIHTDKGAQTTLDALSLGAVDFFLKDDLLHENASNETIQDFLLRIKEAARANVNVQRFSQEAKMEGEKAGQRAMCCADLVIIGTSTGGPSALQSILPRFTPDFPLPIVVIQHMPLGFTKPLADRFDSICHLRVKEAEHGDELEPGVIYIAPSGYQTLLQKSANGRCAVHIQSYSPMETYYKPSLDVTLSSAAPIFKDRLLAVVLTGMGHDGLEGCRTVKQYQGHILAEAEESCIVYGMPKAVYEAGLADRQILLPHMFQGIMSFLHNGDG